MEISFIAENVPRLLEKRRGCSVGVVRSEITEARSV